ncbi:Leucine-rich repeat LGI family member 2 [Bagarius yarrelli]|uniref:Leucine-rich repeat LGI family member 2 n=1 Tax=Bagarius yarrelli TaxID=175774 RepID=A0A556VX61_BAGYA|nr:Leucine-rich repeat LGI family member 2 [Bagarius yarrelli]
MSGAARAPVWFCALVLFFLLCYSEAKRVFKCPSGCTCTTETIICVASSFIPRTVPADISSLSIVNGTFPEIKEAAFALMPSLHLLFIEGNKIDEISKHAFRGLRDVTHLSLANNNLKSLPKDFIPHQTINTQSMSADVFSHKDDVYVALAVPNSDSCLILEWDHIETHFRAFDNITGRSVIGCRSVLINEQALVIVAQLFNGSRVYRFDQEQNQFTKFQTVEMLNVSKPNDIEVFRLGDDWFFLMVDSSKAGMSTLFKWNNTGFFPHQFLHEWFRDLDAEFLDLDGKPVLIMTSRSQAPVIYQWNKNTQTFVLFKDIPNVDDMVSVKAFRIERVVYLALACYIGDSKVLKWTGKRFEEVQSFPSRGAMVLQPFRFRDQHYLILSSDYSFSQIFRWDLDKQMFIKFREVYVQWPRSFTAFSTPQRDFLLATSFKGKTKVFEHVSVDYS